MSWLSRRTKRSPFNPSAALVCSAMLILSASQSLAGKSSDTLVWATDRKVDVVLPYYNNAREMVIMAGLAWDSLIYRDTETLEYKPQLATSWNWIDNVTLDLVLRRDIKFHNGQNFSADDVVETLNHVSSPVSGVLTKRNVSWIKSAEKLADFKVRINLVKPFPAAMEYLAGPIAILPAGIWKTATKDANGKVDYGTVKPIGTGPYKIVKVLPGASIHMQINKGYWEGSPKGKPSIGKIVFKTVSDPERQIAQLLTGELDWIWDVPKDKAKELAKMGQVQVVNEKTMRVSYISMDRAGRAGTDKMQNPFVDIKVRQAIAHAIDRQAIAKNLVGQASDVIHSACYPTQFGCTQNVTQYAYDPSKAKKLLKEAGYPDGFTTDIYAYRQREYTEAVMVDLQKIGIKTNLKFMPFKALRALVWEGKAPFHHMTWGSYSMNDVSAITSHFFKHGRDDYCRDPDVKKWLDIADTSTDSEVRMENYAKALKRIQDNLCWLPMFTYAKNYAFAKDLDFKPTNDETPRFFSAKWK